MSDASGPYKGKTCFVRRHDRINVSVNLGFGVTSVQELRIKNLDLLPGTDPEDVKGCLVILIGGHHVTLAEIEVPRNGVRAARFFKQSKEVPTEEGVRFEEFDGKVWTDLGDYLSYLGRTGALNPEGVKRERSRWK